MKKLLLFGLGVIASLSTLTSCKKDEVAIASPTVSFANNEISYVAKSESDTTRDLTVTVEAPGELTIIKIFEVKTSGKTTLKTISNFTDKTKHVFTYTIVSKPNSGDYKIEVEATDKKNNTSSSFFTVKTFTPAVALLNTYTAVLVGGQSNYSGAFGCFYSSTNNLAYNLTDAKSNSGSVDFIYSYGPTYKAHLAAPSDVVMATGLANNLTTKNATIIGKTTLTANDFDGITKESEITSLSFGTDTYAKLLAVNDVVAFKTVKGKIGLVKILEINKGTTGSTDPEQYGSGTMKIQVKVQK